MTYEKVLDICIQRVRSNIEAFAGTFPHIGNGNRFELGPNDHWMTSFWTGELWLSYAACDDSYFRNAAASHLRSFQHRLDNNINIDHDLGFLYTLSACAQYQMTGYAAAKTLAIAAAERLIKRFNSNGGYIQTWKEVGHPEEAGRFIVDSMLNIPLLYWATSQTADPRYATAAMLHAQTTQRYIVRPDGSAAHSFFMNPQTGEPISQKTVQGYADDSLWARGQAWAINGFALAYEWSGETSFLATSQKTADCFLAVITPDYVPLWDFRLPDDPDVPHVRDTSAAAIAAVGMMRLARLLDGADSERFKTAAQRLIDVQIQVAFDPTNEGVQGLLRDGTYDAANPAHTEQYTLFGDYFFMEALMWLTGHHVDLFGPGIGSGW